MIINSVLLFISSFLCLGYSRANSLLSGNSLWENDAPDSELPSDLIEKTEKIRNQGVEWLLAQRTEEFGWPLGDTARVVVAIASALEDWPEKNDLAARLSVKQLEIELLEKFLRKDIDPVTPAQVASFSLALNAVCKDPHNFYGHNLIASLEKHHADADFPGYPETFGYSLTALVTCLGGSHLHKRQTRHLLQIARDESARPFSVDTRSMALMALECVRHRKNSDSLTRHMHDPLEAISEKQKPDGSFGSIHTSALAIQALGGSGDFEINWNRSSAVLFLDALQEPNGSFLNSIPATAECVIAASTLLNGVGVLGLRKTRCTLLRHRYKSKTTSTSTNTIDTSSTYVVDNKQQIPSHDNGDNELRPLVQLQLKPDSLALTPNPNSVQQEVQENSIIADDTSVTEKPDTSATSTPNPPSSTPAEAQLATVKYWLWIGPDPSTTEKHNLTLQVAINSTFFYVMQRAAEITPDFEFSSTVWPNGHYVHTISGHREQPIGYHYWLLYCLKSDPDPLSPPSTTFVAPAGVDDLRVQDGQIYLFWFKKI